MNPVSFHVWIESANGDAEAVRFHLLVGLRHTLISDGTSIFRLPYLTKRNCYELEEYKLVWIEELSRDVHLKVLGFGLDHRVFSLLPQCYDPYLRAKHTDIIP